ncbi:flagellar hook-associated protein FlgK [Rhodoferax sp. AJA081-3]|uniref:flagellar hook-associated protein FlgK n=1 Tax=Rhodoferax sp. AJA081-3 TaxID=2752316 RepID=UPI001AE04EFD|nr:flagellar hook-associated protein FlgK [Rhodoferax sp. AJA081-3]QTN30289.1 flagellar hook-associated protein FlgK [Rhodoferax sp. AJA081-3]
MGSLLNIGSRALQANQAALQTAGNNIANVNVPGYSRQKVVLNTVPGQFSSAGYVGQGVTVQTIQRNFSEFLTRQSRIAASAQSADTTRSDKLRQLEAVFQGGAQGLGASINDMLNAFSDVASAPTDMTARTVVLTRIDETASRMRAASQQLDDLQTGVTQELAQKITNINSLATSIAAVNEQIARTNGTGQPPNDLLDRRDQLIKELNQYVQTTSIAADDGTVGLYIAGSQELVLGTNASTVALVSDDFGDTRSSKLAIMRAGVPNTLDENMLGGGEVSGLLRFQNNDLNEGRNLLGRLTLATTGAMNDQHKLGLDLNGNVGGDLFSPIVLGTSNVFEPKAPAALNTGSMSGAAAPTLSVSDRTQLVASDYEMQFSGGTFTITRRSDGAVFTQAQVPPGPTAGPDVIAEIDGLQIHNPLGGAANPGDRFLFKPFSTSASNISSMFSTPRALAVASPVAATMGTANAGSLQQISVSARSNPISPAALGVVLTFSNSNTYSRSDGMVNPFPTRFDGSPNPLFGTTDFEYIPGQTIEATPGVSPPAEWSLTLQGTPAAGDTVTVNTNLFPTLSSGNATAMMNLRDVAMFDGAALTDGYAGLISQIGIRTQSAEYAALVSSSIATNVERDRAGVSGVNLDEEAASLLQFQQAYQASAKMIQVAQSIFDTLIQNLGR